MKTYRVWCVLDEWQELVFADSPNEAKRCVASAYSSPYEDLRARCIKHMHRTSVRHQFANIEQDKHITRLSGIFHCRNCGNQNGDGDLCCAECEETL